jgi:4-hydroxy-tetrahydrodipicolinate synthase
MKMVIWVVEVLQTFGAVLTAMATPFNDDLALDLIKAATLAQYLVRNGSDGLVLSGTTGESPTLTNEEKLYLFQVVKEAVGDQTVIIANTGSNTTRASISLTQAAEKIGVDGVMLVVPYYNKPSQAGLYEHFKVIAGATSLPVMIYNIPGRTGINLLPETIIRLAELENIVALKQANGSMEELSEIIQRVKPGFKVYSGDDSLTLPMASLGADGVVSVASHLVGNEMQAMLNYFTSGNVDAAKRIHHRLFPLFKALFITSNPVPLKAALKLAGLNAGGVRLPLVDAGQGEIEVVRRAMEPLNLVNHLV